MEMKKFRVHAVGAPSALHQAQPGRRRGDQQHGLLEAGIDQGLLDLACELEVEGIFWDASRAHCAGYIGGVADIDHDAEGEARAILGRRLGYALGALLGAQPLCPGRQQGDCKNNA